jgi:uncharacterized protein (UPF0276 family)
MGAEGVEAAGGAAAVAAKQMDKVGIGWRESIAGGILNSLDEIDAIEVIAENYASASRRQLRGLRALGRERPLLVHGVAIGPASVSPVDRRRADATARIVELLEPVGWSEHLSLVRSGGTEIGHLIAPPRTDASIDGAVSNLAVIGAIVGGSPAVENVANLMRPPGSTLDEPTWVNAILAGSGCHLLLDLHNLYANALNFGDDPIAFMRRFDLDRVEFVHISGGRWIFSTEGTVHNLVTRLLDDHQHDVPDAVFELLVVLGERCPHALTVILERDGQFPSLEVLLAQIRRARAALASGRRNRAVESLEQAHELSAA